MLTAQEIVRLIGRPDPTILDIGCNDGEHTELFLSLFLDARVFCFEPEPRAQRKFAARVQDVRARLFPLALGAVDGTTAFHRSGGQPGGAAGDPWDLSGSIRAPKHHLNVHPWCSFDEQIDVPVMRLDSWAAQQGVQAVDFIWADMQGAEGDLIAGGRETLARTRYLYTEYNDHEMYEGQPSLEGLRRMLPDFELLHAYAEDALFGRTH